MKLTKTLTFGLLLGAITLPAFATSLSPINSPDHHKTKVTLVVDHDFINKNINFKVREDINQAMI